MWLETQGRPGAPATQAEDVLAVRAWGMMSGQMDWPAVPIIADLLGYEDIESLSSDLLTIREHVERLREKSAEYR